MRTIVGRVLLGAALMATAVGCDWQMVRGDAARTGNAVETTIGVGNVAGLKRAWSVDTGDAAPRNVVTGAGAVALVRGDRVQGYEAATGEPRFDTPLPPFPFPELGQRDWTGSGAKGGTLLLGYGDPLTSGGAQGGFVSVDMATGTLTSGGVGAGDVPTSDPAFAGPELWYAYAAGSPLMGGIFAGIVGVLADGHNVRTGVDIAGTGAMAGPPVVSGGLVYHVRPGGGSIDAIDAAGIDGCPGLFCEPLWSAPVTGYPAVAASGARLVAANSTGIAAYAVGPGVRGPDQQPVWQASVPGASAVALTPAANATSVLVGADDGTLRAYAAGGCGAATCAPTWNGAIGGAATSPVIANGVAYVGSADGHVYAFAAAGCGGATCQPLWSAATPGAVSRVIVANGRVFVTTATGDLVAYQLP